MRYQDLISKSNLELAWRRITTGQNLQHKRYFRDLYDTYEIAKDENLKDLRSRLRGKSFQPLEPTRIYVPKPSGLQRPLTLLSIEDQIILQAISNLVVKKCLRRRKAVQLKYVFSNVFSDDKNIFLFRDWRQTYTKFQDKVRGFYNSGLTWVADFDLAAFYDTISHDLLFSTVYPQNTFLEDEKLVRGWLKTWSSDKVANAYTHGIPQGPLASDVLAECFLLPIDEELSQHYSYIRYVDDIRIFGTTEAEVREAALRLEVLCRERGLIPQGDKFSIREVESEDDAMGAMPSLGPDAGSSHDSKQKIPKDEALEKFRESLEGKTQRIADKTRARYILYNASPSPQLLTYVLRLMPRHPEHADAFVHYLGHYQDSKKIVRACKQYLLETPYEYVQGEMWHVLSRMASPEEIAELCPKALEVAEDQKANFAAKWGACHFLCKAHQSGLGNFSEAIKCQSSALLKALLVPVIPGSQYHENGIVGAILKDPCFEPGIMLAEQFIQKGMTHLEFGIQDAALQSQVRNTFIKLNIIRQKTGDVDPMGETLANRYRIDKWSGWKQLFGQEYFHALAILNQADPVFDSGRSTWLNYQNSFNDALVRALQRHLHASQLPGAVKTIDKNGELITLGTILQPNNKFSKNFPLITATLREVNNRRNAMPGSHPYEAKGGTRNEFLKRAEQKRLAGHLASTYQEIVNIGHSWFC